MVITTLASSSSSNCAIVEISGETFIVDTGKTAVETINENLNGKKCAAILITHSHSDHLSKNTFKISQELNTPIYIKKESINRLINKHEKYISNHPEGLIKIFDSNKLTFGNVSVELAELTHKGMGRNKHSSAYSYFFKSGEETLYFATDIGEITPDVQNFINKADALVIEANHEPEKVKGSGRYYKHKDWLLSSSGHISNSEAAEAIKKGIAKRGKPYKKIILAHLSKQCNTPQQALQTVYEAVKESGQKKEDILTAPPNGVLKVSV